MLTQRTCVVTKTALVGGTVYHEASWWALTNDGCAVAGPCSSERKLRREMAELNRLIRAGAYADRP